MDMQLKQDFLKKWGKYFAKAELPFACYYTDHVQDADIQPPAKGRSCIICELARVRNGVNLAYGKESIACSGARRYLGYSEKLYHMAIEKAGGKPIIVINTHYHGDHVQGNHFFKGSKIYMGSYDKTFLARNVDPADMPTNFVTDSLILVLGDEVLKLRNYGQAHTWDDMVVYLVNRKILFAGDLVQNQTNPFLIKESGADVDKWIKTLNCMRCHYKPVVLVPGHGNLGDSTLMRVMQQYFKDMKEAAANPAKEKELVEKYKDWHGMRSMASPEKTIEYIRQK